MLVATVWTSCAVLVPCGIHLTFVVAQRPGLVGKDWSPRTTMILGPPKGWFLSLIRDSIVVISLTSIAATNVTC